MELNHLYGITLYKCQKLSLPHPLFILFSTCSSRPGIDTSQMKEQGGISSCKGEAWSCLFMMPLRSCCFAEAYKSGYQAPGHHTLRGPLRVAA